jgi:hypothetical protein
MVTMFMTVSHLVWSAHFKPFPSVSCSRMFSVFSFFSFDDIGSLTCANLATPDCTRITFIHVTTPQFHHLAHFVALLLSGNRDMMFPYPALEMMLVYLSSTPRSTRAHRPHAHNILHHFSSSPRRRRRQNLAETMVTHPA